MRGEFSMSAIGLWAFRDMKADYGFIGKIFPISVTKVNLVKKSMY
jgi:hypothetical protein